MSDSIVLHLQHVEALEILLQGLCGVRRERLRVHELCLKSGPNLGKVINISWSYRLLYHSGRISKSDSDGY